MELNLTQELAHLRTTYAVSSPAARLRVIKQRLTRAEAEAGPSRLVTVVSAVEALARSLVVHSSGRPANTAAMRYTQVRHAGPVELVEEVLRLRGAPAAATYFAGETWTLFELANQYRNLVVHECTYLGHDRYPALISAAEGVFHSLVELAGLPRPVN
ncbi:MAG: hypothetical protein JWQ33_2658 [Ramlibacter sp.]|nr:hypothetical protein [Ramlibacter sp.]